MKKYQRQQWLGLVAVLAILLTACTSKTPASVISPLASPLQVKDSPLATPALEPTPASFRLDKPIVAGVTEVTGQGIKDISVVLVDVTMGGNILGITTVNREGRFVFKLGTPLEAAHRLGLTLGDVSSTGKRHEDFFDERFYGDEPFSIPQIGFFFDTALVKE